MSELSKGMAVLAAYGEAEATERAASRLINDNAEARTAEDWAKTPEHAAHMIKVLQSGIRRDRAAIADLQGSVTRNVESLRAVQAKAYREGWELSGGN